MREAKIKSSSNSSHVSEREGEERWRKTALGQWYALEELEHGRAMGNTPEVCAHSQRPAIRTHPNLSYMRLEYLDGTECRYRKIQPVELTWALEHVRKKYCTSCGYLWNIDHFRVYTCWIFLEFWRYPSWKDENDDIFRLYASHFCERCFCLMLFTCFWVSFKNPCESFGSSLISFDLTPVASIRLGN